MGFCEGGVLGGGVRDGWGVEISRVEISRMEDFCLEYLVGGSTWWERHRCGRLAMKAVGIPAPRYSTSTSGAACIVLGLAYLMSSTSLAESIQHLRTYGTSNHTV